MLVYNYFVMLLLHCSQAGQSTSNSNWPSIFERCLVHIVGNQGFENYNGYASIVPIFYETNVLTGIPEAFIAKLGKVHLYQNKFTLCKVKILGFEDVMAELDTSKLQKKLTTASKIQTIAKFHVNPDYVVYISNSSIENWSSSAWIFCRGFSTFSGTAKFLVVSPSQDSVGISIVVLHRRDPNNKMQTFQFPDEDEEARSALDLQWRFLHRNLEGRTILFFTEEWEIKSFEGLFQIGGCGISQRFEISERYCATFALFQHLNFSPFTTAADFAGTYGHVLLNVIYSGKNEEFNKVFSSSAYPKYDWLIMAELQEPFSFAVIIDSDSLGHSAIWKPFEIYIWIAILICFVCTAAALTGISADVRSEPIPKFGRHLFNLFKILLEQGEVFFNRLNSKRNRQNKPKIILMVIWLWMAFLLGNAYKGTLFSFLTNHIPPLIPETIQELISSPFRVFTTSASVEMVGNELVSTSVLTDAILRDLMIGIPGTDFPKHYFDLNQSVIFISEPLPKLIASVPSGNQIQTSTGHMAIPKSFAIINSETELNQFLQLTRRVLPNKFIFTGGKMDTKFSTRMPWIVMRNFFESIMSPVLAALYESGIYDKWSKCIQSSYINNYYKEWLDLSKTTGQSQPRFKSQRKAGNDAADGPKPLNFIALKNIFVLSLICIVTSGMVLIVELVINCSIPKLIPRK